MFLTLKLFKKQFESMHHPLCEHRETSTFEYISLQTVFLFYLNVLLFELQHEWTPPQIIFCRHCVLQLFCHNVEGESQWYQLQSKNTGTEILLISETSVYIFTRGNNQRCSIKKNILKIFAIFTGKHLRIFQNF